MADPCGDRQLVAANWRLASPVAPVTAEREREREREREGAAAVSSLTWSRDTGGDTGTSQSEGATRDRAGSMGGFSKRKSRREE